MSITPFDTWLPKVVDDQIHVDVGEGGLIAEARANLRGFGLSSDQMNDVSEADIVHFVHAVEHSREAEILQRFGKHPMTFYCWVDEMAGELRLSMVSASNGRTGFGGPIEETEDLDEIARQFLSLGHHDGIPMEEFRVMTQGDIETYVEPLVTATRVWVSLLPR